MVILERFRLAEILNRCGSAFERVTCRLNNLISMNFHFNFTYFEVGSDDEIAFKPNPYLGSLFGGLV